MKSIHDGHRERLRARFTKNGLAGFEAHTALELLLFYARPRCDTNELAHRLIERFGSFAAVLDAPQDELARVPGVGEATAVFLKLIPQAGAFYLDSRAAVGDVLDATEKAGAYFVPKFLGLRSEVVYMAALDDKRKVIRCARLTDEGIVNAVRITVKKVVAEALNANATGVILAHNHPGGVALPSPDDRQLTAQIYKGLQLIHVELLDHIVVADDDFVSMADSGYFENFRRD